MHVYFTWKKVIFLKKVLTSFPRLTLCNISNCLSSASDVLLSVEGESTLSYMQRTEFSQEGTLYITTSVATVQNVRHPTCLQATSDELDLP